MTTAEEAKLTCAHVHVDGAGSYCKAISVQQLQETGRLSKDYPHRFWRSDCYGRFGQCRFRDLFKGKRP